MVFSADEFINCTLKHCVVLQIFLRVDEGAKQHIVKENVLCHLQVLFISLDQLCSVCRSVKVFFSF